MTYLLALCGLLIISQAHAAPAQTVVLDVKNMSCALCPVTVKKSLQKVPGVEQASIDFDNKTATVKFDPDKVTRQALAKATTDAGYPSAPRP